MANTCKNCGASIIFHPAIQKVLCQSCGSTWEPEELVLDEEDVSVSDAKKPEPFSKSYIRQKMFNCFIHTCNACGAELLVTSAETSMTCSFCGSTNMVKSRLTKEKRPDYILPFQCSKETAIRQIQEYCQNKILMPDAFKKLDPESVRGIYIPYWLTNVHHAEAGVFQGEVSDGENMTVYYYGRSVSMEFTDLQIEGSEALDDACSERLGLFDLDKLRPFHENYLLGFYSDRSDMRFIGLRRAVRKKTVDLFRNFCIRDIRAANKSLVKEDHKTIIGNDIRYALFPVWFVTAEYNHERYTILVNGESGKVAGVIPFEEKKFRKTVLVGGAVIGLVIALLALMIRLPNDDAYAVTSPLSLIVISVILTLLLSGTFLLVGNTFLTAVEKLQSLTKNQRLINFAKKREG